MINFKDHKMVIDAFEKNATTLLYSSLAFFVLCFAFIIQRYFKKEKSYAQSIKKELRIEKIFIHPIKSCRGSSVKESKFDEGGLEYDRLWLIIDSKTKKFQTARELPKMVTITPKMDIQNNILEITIPFHDQGKGSVIIKVSLNPTKEELSKMEVIEKIDIWGDEVNGFAISKKADEILTEFFKKPVRLVRKGTSLRNAGPDDPRGKKSVMNYQDFYPILIASKASIQNVRDNLMASIYPHFFTDKTKVSTQQQIQSFKVSDKIDKQRWTPEELESFPIERFRPNIVVESFNDDQGRNPEKTLIPWEEDAWTHVEIFDGQKSIATEIGFGSSIIGKGTSIDCVARCGRCMVPNTDMTTGIRDNFVPYTILQKFRQVQPEYARKGKPCFGVLASPAQPSGIVRVGDIVRVTNVMDPALRKLGV